MAIQNKMPDMMDFQLV